MNMFSTEATKQTSNYELPGDKSVSKHLQGLSLTGGNSVDKHIEEEIVERNQQAIAAYNPQTIEIHRKIKDLEPLRLNIPRGIMQSTSNEKPFLSNPKEQTPQRPSNNNFFGNTPSSVDKGATKYNKKRKSDRLIKTQERGKIDPLLSNITKKVKITPNLNNHLNPNPNPNSFFDDDIEGGKNEVGVSDCSLGSQDNGRTGNKENYFMGGGMNRSKITDFFVKSKEQIEQASHSKESTFGSKSKFLNAHNSLFSAIPEELPTGWEDERNRFIEKINDLEDKLANMKKEREKEMTKSEMVITRMKDEFDEYKGAVHKLLAKFSLEIENYKRIERKTQLNQQKQRLGEYVSQRGGSKFVDVWSDGQEIRQVKECLATINADKEELERQKKALKSRKTVIGVTKSTHTDVQLSLSGSYLGFFGDNSDSNSMTDLNENKERINAKMAMLTREEAELRDKLDKLEAEKAIFYQQFKKQYEEDHSRYGKPNQETNSPAWPILQNRYQLLSLLGKGGFSEVYKAFDLEKFRFTACKLHQLNPNWTENAKANYVKHANREFEVHKELNHPNIVRLYDCLHIDDNSFATVLEYCEGSDLSGYLKQHKILPEREAKIIIRQIICGLKYLNEHKTKIIHYDLKPQNVIFHKGEIKISDFGLCKVLEGDETKIELTSQGVGTYWYLPPECFEMDDNPPLINSKVDVWSVGVMFYEMLFGMRPFGHNMSQEKILKEQIILKSYSVNIPSKPIVSNEAKEFIKRCLAYRQEDRFDVEQAYNSPLFTRNM